MGDIRYRDYKAAKTMRSKPQNKVISDFSTITVAGLRVGNLKQYAS